MAKISVLIVDDHAMFREGIRALLSRYDDMAVVGEAADGKEALEKVYQIHPDVVLMDIAMPGLGGLEATAEIKRISPQTHVLILTMHENREYIHPILKAGASGYLLKKAAGAELVTAIRAIQSGGAYLDPALTPAVIEQYLAKDGSTSTSYERLSEREKQVLKLVAEGRSNKEIAEMLCLSVKTVRGHRANLMEKLDIHNRSELVRYAIRHGLIQP